MHAVRDEHHARVAGCEGLCDERGVQPCLVGTVTVTPTLAAGGSATNTVPAEGTFHVDARATTRAEQDALHQRMAALTPVLPGAALTVDGGPNRPPREASQAAHLLALARATAADLGLGHIRALSVGGASDGNITAGIGVPTLDGLGAVGAHAHAEGEYAIIAEMPRRSALVAGLTARLLPPA
ncbi:hypothetical protein ABZ078_15940 [Streptomyces sp. NPDC006385]|uniref:hypothetical protein n=1 Tax=Streptomyces sp. NPDC006385 TaxID=3156761 RepID=UPI00339E3E04